MTALFRYGGWYTDLDTVTIRPTNHLRNTVAISGDFVANGNLVFSKNYTFLWKLMIKANARYTGVGWNSLGPVLLTDVIRKDFLGRRHSMICNHCRDLCHLGKGQNEPLLGHHPNCYNLTVLNHSYFYPIKHIDRMILFQSNKEKFWEKLFSKALSVHFYGSNTSGRFAAPSQSGLTSTVSGVDGSRENPLLTITLERSIVQWFIPYRIT